MTVEADVAGTVHQPDFNAEVNVTDLAWQPEKLPLAVSGMNGRMTLSPDRVTIHELTTQINQGRVTLNGEAFADFGDGNPPGSGKKMKAITAALNLSGSDITLPVADKETETVWMESLASSVKIHLDVSQLQEVSQKQTRDSAGPPDSGVSSRIPVQSIMAVLGVNQAEQQGLDLSVTLDQTIGLKASFNPETSQFDIHTEFAGTSLDPFLETAGLSSVFGQLDGQVQTRGWIDMNLPPQVTEQLKPAKGALQVQAEVGDRFQSRR